MRQNHTTSAFDLPVHPAAKALPILDDDQLQTLAKNIKKRGLLVPLGVYEGELIDGRNRREACRVAGVEPKTVDVTEQVRRFGGPARYVVAMNVHRRHLTLEQRKEAVAVLLKEDPNRSNNAVAADAGVSDKTAKKVRERLEGRSEIPNVDSRTDSKGRTQAARKPARKKRPTPPPKAETPGPKDQAPPPAAQDKRRADRDAKLLGLIGEAERLLLDGKPYQAAELLSRMRALLKKAGG